MALLRVLPRHLSLPPPRHARVWRLLACTLAALGGSGVGAGRAAAQLPIMPTDPPMPRAAPQLGMPGQMFTAAEAYGLDDLRNVSALALWNEESSGAALLIRAGPLDRVSLFSVALGLKGAEAAARRRGGLVAFDWSTTPEPLSLTLFAFGLLGVGSMARRRRQRREYPDS